MLTFHSHCQIDYRTRHDRRQHTNDAWNVQYLALVKAFLYWDCHGAPSSVLSHDAGGDGVICIMCMDIFTRST